MCWGSISGPQDDGAKLARPTSAPRIGAEALEGPLLVSQINQEEALGPGHTQAASLKQDASPSQPSAPLILLGLLCGAPLSCRAPSMSSGLQGNGMGCEERPKDGPSGQQATVEP